MDNCKWNQTESEIVRFFFFCHFQNQQMPKNMFVQHCMEGLPNFKYFMTMH
jgi:hypothetical protein